MHTLGYEVVATVSQRRDSLASGTVLGEGKLKELAALTGGAGEVPCGAPERKSKARARFAGQGRDGDEGDDDDATRTTTPATDEDDRRRADGDDRAATSAPRSSSSITSSRRARRATSSAPPAPQVLDRTGVIVEIFHRHAQSREARMQVEIARLNYVAPRMRESPRRASERAGTAAAPASRRSSSTGARSATASPSCARSSRAIAEGAAASAATRASDQPRVALVGYTNAGKSSLMRALTGSDVLVADKLFATLDTTVRALHPETKPRILVSRHGRLHQEAAARSGRLVPLDARRGARGVAAALRGRRLRSDVPRRSSR